MATASERADRDRRVLELRRSGLTFDRIAQETGFASKGAAYKAYQRALTATGGPEMDRERARLQEVDRLDRLMLVAWPKAMKGELEYMREVRQLSRLRAAYLGLMISPQSLLSGIEDEDDGDRPKNVVPPSRLQQLREGGSSVRRRGGSA